MRDRRLGCWNHDGVRLRLSEVQRGVVKRCFKAKLLTRWLVTDACKFISTLIVMVNIFEQRIFVYSFCVSLPSGAHTPLMLHWNNAPRDVECSGWFRDGWSFHRWLSCVASWRRFVLSSVCVVNILLNSSSCAVINIRVRWLKSPVADFVKLYRNVYSRSLVNSPVAEPLVSRIQRVRI